MRSAIRGGDNNSEVIPAKLALAKAGGGNPGEDDLAWTGRQFLAGSDLFTCSGEGAEEEEILEGQMKEDLDRYLEEAGLDGLLVMGPAAHNANMTYFPGPAHIGWGVLARKRNTPPVLYCNDMERDEVARSGLRFGKFDLAAYSDEAGSEPRDIKAIGLEHILRENNLTGRIPVCGQADVGETMEIFRRLETRLPGLEVVGFDGSTSPLLPARATQDQDEVDRIRRMGAITVQVAGLVAAFPTSPDV